ncbi:MAG TPA: class I SAM-dependent methyltransferase [Steroidobacteraceae bacterium]|nr:class I SAM-dependent methyltransferase [Steroidobacteraceae bacterium]
MKPVRLLLASLTSIVLATSLAAAQTSSESLPTIAVPGTVDKDVPFVPSPDAVVAKMLEMAMVGPKDVVYDLGSGDGRIVIAAAKKGARAVGVDIDPERIRESNQNAREAGVQKRVKFIEQNLFDTDFREASVVTLYLLPGVNMKLRPKLLSELRPGTRIVSHSFDMGDWAPAKTAQVDGANVYLWIIPPRTAASAPKRDAASR